MRRRPLLVCLLLAAVVSPCLAEAQVIQRPPRVYRGLFGASRPDPNRWRHDVTLSANALGGFDDNLTPVAGDAPETITATVGARGYMGFGGALLSYTMTRATTSLEVTARGYTNAFRGLGLRPVYGGDGSVRFSAPFGGRTTLSVGGQYRDDPLFAPGVTAPRSPIANPTEAPEPPPVVNSTTGYLARRSQVSDGNLSIQHRWSPQSSFSGGVTLSNSRYEDGSGDNQMMGGSFTYSRTLGRTSSVNVSHNYSAADTRDASGGTRPRDNNALNLSLAHSHRLSQTRQVALSIGGGATRVDSMSSVSSSPVSYITPSGNASFSVDLTRSWTLNADYGRTVSVIEGVSLDSFVTNNASLRVGGLLGSRGDLALTTNWVAGRAGAEGAGTYTSYTAIAQVQFTVNRWMNAMVSHTFYSYRLEGVTTITEGLATNLDRNALRVGFTFNLPLFGTYSATNPRVGGD